MWKNYFVVAWRNTINHPGRVLLNLASLTIGLSIVICLAAYIHFENSYENHFDNADELYFVNMDYGPTSHNSAHPSLIDHLNERAKGVFEYTSTLPSYPYDVSKDEIDPKKNTYQ